VDSPISVEEAIRLVLLHVEPLEACVVRLGPELLGRTIAQDVVARENFPPFAASIMDGYAVVGPLDPGDYPLSEVIHAGASPAAPLLRGQVAYITTGAMLPEGANAVVKVEVTQRVGDVITIKEAVAAGENVREIGSDIAEGEALLRRGQVLGPCELGVLATTGFAEVRCFASPVIGVMSTGNELVEAWETPVGAQVRDCNRLALIAACTEAGQGRVLDLGIVPDNKDELRRRLLAASAQCDVVISSGGVSMGAADFVKPLLREIGQVHFSKLNMKPGKPTCFASFQRDPTDPASRPGKTYFFGLPGNPVSCLVTKALFVDPAVRRLQGRRSEACLHAQLSVRLAGSPIRLDPERPEYHRAVLCPGENGVLAMSTGFQRSSRLVSMLQANALLFLPRGPGSIPVGASLQALVIGPLDFAPRGQSVHTSAALLDYEDEEGAGGMEGVVSPDAVISLSSLGAGQYESFPAGGGAGKLTASMVEAAAGGAAVLADWRCIRVGLLSVSDRASQGVYADLSGPEMSRMLQAMSEASDCPLTFVVAHTAIVPDEAAAIGSVVCAWTEPGSPQCVDLLLTSGGTGFGLRDLTPEAIRPLLHREAPGVAQALLSEGLKHTPLAVMSRPVVGTRHKTFIATLPGSVKAIKENIVCLRVLLPRVMELLKAENPSDPPSK